MQNLNLRSCEIVRYIETGTITAGTITQEQLEDLTCFISEAAEYGSEVFKTMASIADVFSKLEEVEETFDRISDTEEAAEKLNLLDSEYKAVQSTFAEIKEIREEYDSIRWEEDLFQLT